MFNFKLLVIQFCAKLIRVKKKYYISLIGVIMEWKKYFLFSNNEHNVLAIHSDIGLMGFYIKIFF